MLAQKRRDVAGIVKGVVAVFFVHGLLVSPALLEVLELLSLKLFVSLYDELLERPLVIGVFEELDDVLGRLLHLGLGIRIHFHRTLCPTGLELRPLFRHMGALRSSFPL